MANDFDLKAVGLDLVNNLFQSLTALVPRILTALAIILIGYILAKIIEKGLCGLFRKIRLDEFLKRIGVGELFRKVGISGSIGDVIGKVVYFLLLILFIQAAAEAVGLTAITDAFDAFFAYLPNIVAAILIILLGSLISGFAGRMVTQSAKESGMDYAPTLGRVVSALIFFVVAVVAVTQLRIETSIIQSVALVLLGGAAIGFALTFGLGTREITRNIIAGFYARRLFHSGEQVELSGEKGTLVSITPIQTLVEKDKQVVAIPNRIFLEGIVKQKR